MVEVASHDRFAVAAALDGGELPAILTTCPACGTLHRDLLSIQAAIRHAWTPRRPRDLRLPRADASLRRGAVGRRWLDVVSPPLGIALTAVGIAGLFVANVPLDPGLAGGAAAPREIVRYGTTPSSGAPVDGRIGAESQIADPLTVFAGISLGAGGTILGLRHLTARRRAMR